MFESKPRFFAKDHRSFPQLLAAVTTIILIGSAIVMAVDVVSPRQLIGVYLSSVFSGSGPETGIPTARLSPKQFATVTWSGGSTVDGNWSTAANWSPGAPVAGDDLVFPASAARKTNNNNFPAGTSFASLSFEGSGYVINGNAITLTSSIVGSVPAGAPVEFNPNITLGSDVNFYSFGVSYYKIFGSLNLNNNSIFMSPSNNIELYGPITGPGTVYINSQGLAIINGTMSAGALTDVSGGGILRNGGSLGPVTIGGGVLQGTGTMASLDIIGQGKIAPGNGGTATGILGVNGAVVLGQGSSFEMDINGAAVGSQYDQFNVTGGSIDLAGADLRLALGSGFTPTVGQQFTIIQRTGPGSLTGQFLQGSLVLAGTQLFSVTYSANSVVVTALGPQTSISWNGGGVNNKWSTIANWTPNVIPADGISLNFPESASQKINNNDIVGLDLASVTIAGSGYAISGFDVTISGGINASPANSSSSFTAPIKLVTAPQTFTIGGSQLTSFGDIYLNGFSLTVNNSSSAAIGGIVSGSGGLTKSGTGLLKLSNENFYTGVTQVNAGTVSAENESALGDYGAGNQTVVAASGALRIAAPLLLAGGYYEDLTLNGGTLSTAGCTPNCQISGIVTLGANSTMDVSAGERLDLLGGGSGAFSVTKTGGGTLNYSSLVTTFAFSGGTNVVAGTLLGNSVGGGTGNTINLNGGTLGGGGVVFAINANSGKISPSGLLLTQPTAILISSGSVTMTQNATLDVQINGNVPGDSYDRLRSGSSQIFLNGANLTASLGAGYSPPAGTSFNIVKTSGGLFGQFKQGNCIMLGRRRFNIAYEPVGLPVDANLVATANVAPMDFDCDGKTDLSIFRPGPGEWWYLKSTTGGNAAAQFGTSTDKMVPGDYTGDGKNDIAFWRPSTGQWYILRSEDFSFYAFPFGTTGDVPVPADYDGDGKDDAAIFRPANSTWFISNSGGGTTITQFGLTGDLPVNADYDGDGKSDVAIYRPSLGQWWLQRSTAGLIAFQFGQSTDKTVPGDYTGDGKADVAFWRPATGEWYILRSQDSSFYAFPFGANGDLPSPGDYDGDGKYDAAIYRPTGSTWYVNRSGGSGVLIQQFGQAGDLPVPNAYVR